MENKMFSIPVSDSLGSVSAEMLADDNAEYLYVFAHGAGAGMNHPFMARFAMALAGRGIASLRFNFPYMEKGRKRPDAPAVAHLTIKRAIGFACSVNSRAKIIAGGKSFGGRMTSQLMSKGDSMGVKGLIFVGFPLHAAGSPDVERAAHLSDVNVPMLFLQGTRDALAEQRLIQQVCNSLPLATLNMFEGADHGFKSGKSDLIPLLADTVSAWISGL